MTDAISRLGVVVEEKGIQDTLRGLDKLIVMMEKAEKKASSPVSFSVDTRQLDKAAEKQIALADKQKAADQSLARAKEKQETYTTEIRNREAEKRRTIAENEANRQLTVEAKSSAARDQLISQFEERRKTYTSKINDDIQKISEKSEKELAKIRLDADSKVRVARETSLQRIEEAEKRSASSVSAIHQKEREKRITDNARAEQRMSLEVQKASSKSEQLAERSNAQIMAIRERTAAFAEKMNLREQLAAERSLKAQQQGITSMQSLVQGLQGAMTFGFAGFGIQQIITDVIKAADGMTELSSRLKLVTSTTGELNYVQQELYKNSQLAGTKIKDNTEIYFGLARSTRNLNVSQKDLITLTDGLGKAAIVSGANAESYKSAMVQLRQALESGVLRGQEFNSVSEQAPRIMQALADGLGKTTGELRKMAKDGKLTTDVVLPALLTGLNKVNDEYDKIPKTVSRGWNTIENSFLSWVDKANKASGATSILSSGMFSLAESMDKVSGESIVSSLNGITTAAMVLSGVFTSRLIGSFISARKEQLLGIVANYEKVNSDKLTTASAVRVAEQNVATAKTEMDRANATLLAAERDLAAVAAADMLVLATGRLSAAKEAVAIASANQAKASTAVAAAEAEAVIATNAATVAAERHAAAATASGLALRGLGSIFTALGGWVTVAIGVIWGLVTIWDKVANAAENAAQKQKDALEAAKRAQTREDVNALEKDARTKYDMYSKSAASSEIDLKAMSKSDPGYARQQEIVDNFKTQARGWSQTLTQIENVGKEKTATLTKQVESSLDAARSPAQVADAFVEGAKHLSKADKSTKDIQEIITRRDAAIRSIRQSISVEDKRNQVKDPASVIEAEKKIRLSAEKEIKAVKEKNKGPAAKRPELSAGYDAALAAAKEEFELVSKLASAQEKLLGYISPETLARKQAVEVIEEQYNTQSKIAKIEEQLTKKNLGAGVRESLQKTLESYKKRTDFVSEELAVTQALQKEQNNLKIYQEEIVKPAQRRMEVEKATMEMMVQTGQMSSQEAQRQSLINSMKQVELEYSGQIAEAEKTYNSLQEKGYEQAANDAKKRLDRLTDERDAKLEISRIKIDSEEQAKSFEAGFGRAWQKYRDEATDSSKLTEKLMGDVLKGIEDALFKMMNGMKVSFSDLWKSILNDVKRYLAQQMTKEIGDSITGLLSGKSPTSSLDGSSVSGGLSGILGAATTAIKGFGSDILSWVGDFTGSSVITSLSSSVKNASGVVNVANPSFVGPIQPFADAGGSSSALSGIGTGQVVAGLGTAFNLFNSIKTGKGWGATIGGSLGLVNPVAGIIGSLVGGLADSAFGSKGGPKQGGNYNAAFTSTGGVVAENMFGGYTPSELDTQMQTNVKDFQKNYTDLVKQLGGVAKDLTINLGGDQDPLGKAGNRVSAQVAIGAVGTGTSDTAQAERALWNASLYSSVSKSVSGNFDEAVKLETSRMLVAALKSSDLPSEVAKVFEGVDLTNITQAQIDSLLAQATTAADSFKTAEETVKKAAEDLSAILSLFDKWKYVFPNFSKASDTAKKALVDLVGGIDALSGKMSSYYENFYSEAEKSALTWKSISATLSDAGVKTIPKTREEFRKLMDSADISTEAGRKLVNALLSVESEFASVTKSLDDVTKSASDAATATEDKAKADKDAAIKAAQDTLEEARRKVQEAYDREADSLRAVIDRLTQFQDQIKKFRDSLYLDKTLSPLSNYDKYQFAKSRLEEIQAKALLGDEKAQSELEQASRDFLEYSRIYNANNQQYQRDFDSVQAFLNRVQINTKEQIDQAKLQLTKLDKMVEGILTVNASVMTLAQAIAAYQAALAALLAAQGGGDGTTPVPSIPTPTPTPTSPTSGSGTGGVNTPTGNGTVTEAIAPLSGYDQVYPVITNAYNEYFGRAARQAEANYWAQSLGNDAPTNQVRAAIYAGAIGTDLDYMRGVRQGWISTGYQTLFGRQASQAEKDWWYSQLDYSTTSNKVYDMLAAGATGSDLTYLTQNHPWMVNGSHANGLANVPFDGYLAELHQGERVLTKNENSEYSGSTNGFATDVVSPLLKEIAALRAEVKALKQEVSNQGDADRSQRGVIAEAQIKVMQTQAVETIRASNNNL